MPPRLGRVGAAISRFHSTVPSVCCYAELEMSRVTRTGALAAAILVIAAAAVDAQLRDQRFGQIQPRDQAAQTGDQAAVETGAVSGRVVASDTGLPLKRARVSARAQEVRGRIAVTTDERGRYTLSDLAPGRYTISVSKPGFVSLSYGQRRPRQPATPVPVAEGQRVLDVNFSLPSGSVITGRVVDEDGGPLPLTQVTVMRYVYRQGQQQLVPAGNDRSDDRGEYRVFGLEPGDYYISATVPREMLGAPFGPFGGGPGPGGRGGRFGSPVETSEMDDDRELGYAPTYYPGVTGLGQATPVAVGLSAELAGVDFGVQLVPTATVSGVVFGPDGAAPGGAQVILMPDDATTFRGRPLAARAEGDGRFEISDVPPGRYTVRAISRGGVGGRGGPRDLGGNALFASQSLAIDGFDVTDLALVLGAGATVKGSVSFESTHQAAPDDMSRIRVVASALVLTPMMRDASARIANDGTFQLTNVADGPRVVGATNMPTGWLLRAVYLDGRDIIDTPTDFSGTATIDGMRLVFTDQVSELSGVVHDGRGDPLSDFTVIAFPSNEDRWRAQSRYIKASRPDQTGSYQIRGLPPGDYLLAAVDVVEQGEWYDPRFLDRLRSGAVRLSLDQGEAKALNLTLSSPRQ